MAKPRTPHDDGPPVSITIYPTPGGWRHSVSTEKGGLLCGALRHLPTDATGDQARAAATELVRSVGREFHSVELDVDWSPADTEGWWVGAARPHRGS
ncbi:MAG TPA: hypothetical protein VFU65_21795 [Actinocrinis sp.]|nr:hypothetical protein [Actinocrinis sp.]